MCGIVGIVATNNVNQDIFDALTALQHRGQDAAGIVTCEGNKLAMRKSNGLVREVIRTRHMLRLTGTMGLGHVRYPTAGNASCAEAQPFYVNSPYGITLAHNGNLTNTEQLQHELNFTDLRHINTTSDTEVLLNVFAHALQQVNKTKIDENDIFQAVTSVHARCRGAYAVTAMVTGYGIVGFRDPNGIRPLVYGKRETSQGTDYMFASESVALDTLGFTLLGDVAPGEAIYITKEGKFFQRQCAAQPQHAPCLFEYVYLARPDAICDQVSVYAVRFKLGEYLAEKILRQFPHCDIDIVVPIPDTSCIAAFSLAQRLGLPFREIFIKNRYIGRTFIMPGQNLRRKSVRQKLNTISQQFQGKNVLLVDDSIVRGTTSREIIQMVRDAGANKVYFASAAPEVRFPNVYGIDIPVARELIAHGLTTAKIAEELGADWLIFQDLDDLKRAVQSDNPALTQFEDSVFTGHYITQDIDQAYLDHLEAVRNDTAKRSQLVDIDDGLLLDLYY